MEIPSQVKEINSEDMDALVKHAHKEAYPLYPVPRIWSQEELKAMYYKIKEPKDVKR